MLNSKEISKSQCDNSLQGEELSEVVKLQHTSIGRIETKIDKMVYIYKKDSESRSDYVIELADYLTMNRINYISRLDITGAEIIKKVEEKLTDKQYVIISSSVPGAGKSSCALEYAYKKKEDTATERKVVVRWFNASSIDKIDVGYRQIAKELKIDTTQESEELRQSVNSKIKNSIKSPLLFIFDNVELYDDVKNYLINLPNTVKVIITTRVNGLIKHHNDIPEIKLDQLSESEVTEYLKVNLKDIEVSEEDIRATVKKVGLWPYKLSLVIKYLKEDNEFGTIRENLQEILSYIEQNIDQIIYKILEPIIGKETIAWQMLQYAAYLDPDFISIKIFKAIFPTVEDMQLQAEVNKLKPLTSLDIVHKKEGSGLKLHRLIQEEVITYTQKHKQELDKHIIAGQEIFNRLIKVLTELMPILTVGPDKNWTIAALFYPHAVKILNYNVKNNKQAEEAILRTKLGTYNEYVICQFNQSLTYQLEALEIRQALYQDKHPDIALSLNLVGYAYGKLGDTIKEQKHHIEALEMRKALYRSDHDDIAESLNTVGFSYKKLGKVCEGLEYHKQALDMYKKLHKGNHYGIAKSFNFIGFAYEKLGDTKKEQKHYKEALDCKEKALKVFQGLYKDSHPRTANAFNNVGEAYEKLGNAQEGLKYHKQALTMLQEYYKNEPHQYIADALRKVGSAYGKLDKVEEELKSYQKALEIYQKLYKGNNHHSIPWLFDNIGKAYEKSGNMAVELMYKEHALKMRQALYQDKHQNVAYSLHLVGEVYEKLGDTQKGIELYKQAYFIDTKTLGFDHPYTQKLQQLLATKVPEFSIENETREFILERGEFDPITLKIKQKLTWFASNGVHNVKDPFDNNWRATGYIEEVYLKKQLGELTTPKNVELAQMLCFEAINLAIMNENAKERDFTCATEFAKKFPELISKIAFEHSEYFVDGLILRQCVNDEETLIRLLGNNNSIVLKENNYEEISH